MRLPGDADDGGLAREAESSVLAEAVDRIAHQLKNPLQAMTVNLELIRMRAGEGEASEVERLTEVVDDNIRRLDRRIGMLVALARRSPEEAGTSVDLARLAAEAGSAFRLGERDDGPGLRVPEPGEEGRGPARPVVRARPGQLLALILAAAGHASREVGDEPARLEVGGEDGGPGWIELAPGDAWAERGVREALAEQARRAGGEVAAQGGDGPDPAAIRIRFPGA